MLTGGTKETSVAALRGPTGSKSSKAVRFDVSIATSQLQPWRKRTRTNTSRPFQTLRRKKHQHTFKKKKHLETHPNSAASSRSTVWLVRRICLVPRHGIGQDLRHWSHQASEWHERRPTGWGWESCPAGRERRTWLGVLINLAFLGTPNHTASTTFFRDLESLLKEKNGPSLSKCLARLWLHFSTSFRVGTAKTIHRNKKH